MGIIRVLAVLYRRREPSSTVKLVLPFSPSSQPQAHSKQACISGARTKGWANGAYLYDSNAPQQHGRGNCETAAGGRKATARARFWRLGDDLIAIRVHDRGAVDLPRSGGKCHLGCQRTTP